MSCAAALRVVVVAVAAVDDRVAVGEQRRRTRAWSRRSASPGGHHDPDDARRRSSLPIDLFGREGRRRGPRRRSRASCPASDRRRPRGARPGAGAGHVAAHAARARRSPVPCAWALRCRKRGATSCRSCSPQSRTVVNSTPRSSAASELAGRRPGRRRGGRAGPAARATGATAKSPQRLRVDRGCRTSPSAGDRQVVRMRRRRAAGSSRSAGRPCAAGRWSAGSAGRSRAWWRDASVAQQRLDAAQRVGSLVGRRDVGVRRRGSRSRHAAEMRRSLRPRSGRAAPATAVAGQVQLRVADQRQRPSAASASPPAGGRRRGTPRGRPWCCPWTRSRWARRTG